MAQEFQEVVFRDSDGKETIRLSGQGADIFLRANAADSNLVLQDQQGTETIRMSGQGADIYVRANAADANIILQDQQGRDTIRMSGDGADIYVRANAADANIVLQNQQGKDTIFMSGNAGSLRLDGGLFVNGPINVSSRGPNPRGIPGDLEGTEDGRLFFCKEETVLDNKRFLHWVNLTGGEDHLTEKL